MWSFYLIPTILAVKWNPIFSWQYKTCKIEKRNTDWFIWYNTFQARKENHLWRVTASKSQGREIVFVPKSSLSSSLQHFYSYMILKFLPSGTYVPWICITVPSHMKKRLKLLERSLPSKRAVVSCNY